jgi:hypothetical protein
VASAALGHARDRALPSQPVPNRFPSALRRGLVLVAVALTAGACTGSTIVKDYGPEAKANFVDGCSVDRSIQDGQLVEDKLAPRSTCACIYEAIYKTYRLPWEDLAAYEQAVADADPGDPPDMPAQMTKAIRKCTTSGPSAPTTTTSEKPA